MRRNFHGCSGSDPSNADVGPYTPLTKEIDPIEGKIYQRAQLTVGAVHAAMRVCGHALHSRHAVLICNRDMYYIVV